MRLAILIIVILVAAVVSVLLLANRTRSSTGSLSRETRRRDRGAPAASETPALSTSTDIEAAGRERADDTRSRLGGALARRRAGEVVEYEPVAEEELGVTRRQFFNRAILIAVGFSVAGFLPAMLAFLWPFRATGFGGKVKVDKSLPDIISYVQTNRKPYYVPLARTYLVTYPKSALPAAKKVYNPIVYDDMSKGIVALYQRCVHLGCRVPFCESSQWFECPCHGSKYNKVGEKKAGPAPRGLDRWPAVIDGDSVTVDTSGSPILGPPIGTNTTGQEPEGPLCV
ncbi:MAG TPA: ubiquinol-cytochrome c reductase iron-sulfur subunit [Acidimicrobiia bacterium]|nr:ubiquinol-cytochrome c reductase iron-sulfur subunit [Acidimicrobiia bacterium]